MSAEINVHIGEVHVGKNNDVLKALLGSCVGIAFIWRSKKIFGLAHCLLPHTSTPMAGISGRFVNQAIPSLLAMMHIRPENYHEIEAVIAGGGNMTHPETKDSEKLVGSMNFKMAKEMLSEMKIKIIHEDGGGEVGRKIVVSCADGTYQVHRIARIIEAA